MSDPERLHYACRGCGRVGYGERIDNWHRYPSEWFCNGGSLVCSVECIERATGAGCYAWSGNPGESTGLICSLVVGHTGDHIAMGATICGQWPNNLDKMTRVESSCAMAAYVGASQEEILEAEAAGREKARTGVEWAKMDASDWRQRPVEALQFVYLEALYDERAKPCTRCSDANS
jgi:hypothetical protein